MTAFFLFVCAKITSMNILKRGLIFLIGFIILTAFYYAGYIVVHLTNIPLPPAIIGLMLFAFSLINGIIDEKYVKNTCDFLMKNMALFIVPFMGGIIIYKPLLIKNWFVILVVIFLTTTLTIVITGLFVEYGLKLIRLRKMKKSND